MGARIDAFFDSVARRFAQLRQTASNVLGFFGVEVGGAGQAPGAEASPTAMVVAPERGAGDTTVQQENQITINGTDLSPEELQRSITNALEENRQRALRVAERALTTVVG